MLANPQFEAMERETIKRLQMEKLSRLLQWLYEKSNFYRYKMDQAGLTIADFSELGHLSRLPFTTRSDLAAHYPYGMLTFPLSSVARIHVAAASGQQPVAIAYSSADLGRWMEMLSRALIAGGLNAASVIQIAASYGLQPGGLGLHYAVEAVGATVVPVGCVAMAEQLASIEQFGVNALAAPTAYYLELAAAAAKRRVDLRSLPVSTIYNICTSIDDTNKQLMDMFDAAVIDVYSVDELIGPGIASSCSANCGLHLQEDYFLAEIVDCSTGLLKEDGEFGELVLTTLQKEAMPVLRYRTGQVAALARGMCTCGRSTARLIAATARC